MLAISSIAAPPRTALEIDVRRLFYGDHLAVRDVRFDVPKRSVTALIGPSGCGKSTVLRCINRMNDLAPGFRLEGSVRYGSADLYARSVDPVAVRRRIGMVFQQPNPFVSSIFDNVAFGLRLARVRNGLRENVEAALRAAALWDEVKDRLHHSALGLSGGQQQRLCIARALAPGPDVLLMDEPCSALDPIATAKIEELILELAADYTIVIVTHNLQQARRIAEWTAFLCVEVEAGARTGRLVEFGRTSALFEDPREAQTRDYIQGRFG